jgi:hypothetical protein
MTTMSKCPVCGCTKIEEGRTVKGLYLYRCEDCDALRFYCDQKTFELYRKRAQKHPRKTPKSSKKKSMEKYAKIQYNINKRTFSGLVESRKVSGRHLTENFAAQPPDKYMRSDKLWNVTHKPTGLKACSVGSLRAARYLAQAFEKVHPCPGSEDADKVGAEIPKELFNYLKWLRDRSKREIKCFDTWKVEHAD